LILWPNFFYRIVSSKNRKPICNKNDKNIFRQKYFFEYCNYCVVVAVVVVANGTKCEEQRKLKNQRNVINSNICLQIVGVVVVKAAYF